MFETYDFDGTLAATACSQALDYQDGRRITDAPFRPGPLLRARSILRDGGRVAIVTGRTNSQAHLVREWLDRRGLGGAELHTAPAYRGEEWLVKWKAAVLYTLQPEAYHGNESLDEQAARAAGIPFIHVETTQENLKCLNF